MVHDLWHFDSKLIFISSVKYPLSAILCKEALWNVVLQLLWNVKNEDVLEQILNNDFSLEMIYGTIDSEEAKKDHQQKLLQLQSLFSDM